jgi:colanic acid/amylovoran biosynthesis glycosyltransferase
MKVIGFFAPEFPGQTHIWIWRDISHFQELGVEPALISTRMPPKALICHTWTDEAVRMTSYLSPVRPVALLGMLWELTRAGPARWRKCLGACIRAEGLSPAKRLRMAGLALMGAEVVRLARNRGFRHVHVHSCADSANIAMFAHLISGLSYSLTLHGPLRDYGPNQKQKWEHAAFCIVNTRQQLEEVQDQLRDHLPPHIDIAVIGIDQRRFARAQPYQPWQGSGPCRVFSCGRLNAVKGHDDLIRAIALLRQRGLDVRLNIAGEDDSGNGSVRRMLQSMIGDLGLDGVVTLLGVLSEERVIRELLDAHVFALASWAEPLGMATMEAMSACLPVVVTGAGGVREFIDDNVQGLLVEPKSPVQMADGIERVLRDSALASCLADAGKRRIATDFERLRTARIVLERAGLIAAP